MTEWRTDVRAEPVVVVDDSNLEAFRAWDGTDGDYCTEHEEWFDAAVAEYDEAFFEAAGIAAGDQVLDVGCGTGKTTRIAAARCAPGVAVGVDLSSRMLERARNRATAEGLGNVRFLQADAQIAAFEPGTYDVVISRTGAMFFGEPIKAFGNLARALRPNGRLVLLAWQPLPSNAWISEFLAAIAAVRPIPVPAPDAPGPFSLADPHRVQGILSGAGFGQVESLAVMRPMRFGGNAEEAYRLVRGLGLIDFLLRDVDAAARARAEEQLRASIADHDTRHGIWYPSASWLVTARKA